MREGMDIPGPSNIPSVRPSRAYSKDEGSPDFNGAIDKINAALEKSNVIKQPSQPYRKVHVLMIQWNEPPPIAGLNDDLRKVLQTIYGFTLESFIIDRHNQTTSPDFQVTDAIINTRKQMSSDDLLILVYTGYAKYVHVWGRPTLMAIPDDPLCRDQKCGLDWTLMSGLVRAAQCHTLVVLDACFPTSVVPETVGIEVLAASVNHMTAPKHHPNNLTHRLTNLLRSYDGAPVSVAQLHSQLVNGMNEPRTCLETRPIYVPPGDRPSTIISALPSHQQQIPKLAPHPSENTSRVLLKLNISDAPTPANIDTFKRQLKTIVHPRVADFNVEACFEGSDFGSIVLLSVLIEVWDCLAEDPSIEFVSHVKSRDSPLDHERPAERALPMRLRSGRALS